MIVHFVLYMYCTCIVSFAQFVLHIRGSIRYIVGVHNDLWCAAVVVHVLVVHVFGITCIFNICLWSILLHVFHLQLKFQTFNLMRASTMSRIGRLLQFYLN